MQTRRPARAAPAPSGPRRSDGARADTLQPAARRRVVFRWRRASYFGDLPRSREPAPRARSWHARPTRTRGGQGDGGSEKMGPGRRAAGCADPRLARCARGGAHARPDGGREPELDLDGADRARDAHARSACARRRRPVQQRARRAERRARHAAFPLRPLGAERDGLRPRARSARCLPARERREWRHREGLRRRPTRGKRPARSAGEGRLLPPRRARQPGADRLEHVGAGARLERGRRGKLPQETSDAQRNP